MNVTTRFLLIDPITNFGNHFVNWRGIERIFLTHDWMLAIDMIR